MAPPASGDRSTGWVYRSDDPEPPAAASPSPTLLLPAGHVVVRAPEGLVASMLDLLTWPLSFTAIALLALFRSGPADKRW